MQELKQALQFATTLYNVNCIMQIAKDSLTGLTSGQIEELQTIAEERKQAIYNRRYN